MTDQNPESQTPNAGGEQTPSTNWEERVAALEKTNLELQQQKDHWRSKYERDITSATPPATPPTPDGDDEFSEEGRLIMKAVEAMNARLDALTNSQSMDKVLKTYPQLQDKMDEFNEFRQDYPQLSPEKVAKLYLVENDLLEVKPRRSGLESPTRGNAPKATTGMTVEDVRRLRENNPRQYEKMLMSGQLKPEDIQ